MLHKQIFKDYDFEWYKLMSISAQISHKFLNKPVHTRNTIPYLSIILMFPVPFSFFKSLVIIFSRSASPKDLPVAAKNTSSKLGRD
mmetsp:Transcript_43307/g.70279  ORF Transcript_43307/g.70279 Transcript_43307/m.70279 type:complete len:86 (-) Transcript_43307:1291-1548(-)